METELYSLGIKFKHSRPYHPQTCGKVERFHQTLKKFLDKKPRANTVAELQRQVLSRAVSFVGYPYVWGGTSERPQRLFGQAPAW